MANDVEQKHHYHWKMRFSIAIIMLLLSFIGLIVSDVRANGAWEYWRWMVPTFAFLALFLSWYLRRHKGMISPITIWHELFQWFGLILAVYLVSLFVGMGLIGRFGAGLVVLTLLALNIFITGVYVEATFIVLGIILGLFAVVSAFLAEYLYTIILPITIGVAGLLVWVARKRFH